MTPGYYSAQIELPLLLTLQFALPASALTKPTELALAFRPNTSQLKLEEYPLTFIQDNPILQVKTLYLDYNTIFIFLLFHSWWKRSEKVSHQNIFIYFFSSAFISANSKVQSIKWLHSLCSFATLPFAKAKGWGFKISRFAERHQATLHSTNSHSNRHSSSRYRLQQWQCHPNGH